MGKTFKKLFSLFLVGCMTVGLCVGASASSVIGTADDQSIPLHAATGTQGYLNIYGNNVIGNNRNVCTWSYDGTSAQRWKIQVVDGGRVVRSVLNPRYALNPDRRSGQNWNCTVYQYIGNEADALVEVEGYTDYTISLDGYSIYLVNYPGMYLKADGYSNNSNIHWVYNNQAAFGGQATKYVWDLHP